MNEDFYILLIYSQLEGTIAPKEQRQLDEWLAADPEHQVLMEDLAIAYSASENYGDSQAENIDVNAAFAEQLTLIEEKEISKPKIALRKSKSKFSYAPWIRAVAAIALLVMASLPYLRQITSEPTSSIVEVTATADQNIVLADGSEVILSEGSELIYPNQFEAGKRVVQLKKGKATFKVTKGKGQFIVENPNGVVTVLGTEFQLNNESNSNMLQLRVTEGKVNIKNKKGTKSLDVVANESVVVIGEAMYKKKFGKTPVNYFEFQETPLHTVLKELTLHFEQDFEATTGILNCPLTVKFDNQKLEVVVQTIGKLLNSEVNKIGEVYKISGDGCQ